MGCCCYWFPFRSTSPCLDAYYVLYWSLTLTCPCSNVLICSKNFAITEILPFLYFWCEKVGKFLLFLWTVRVELGCLGSCFWERCCVALNQFWKSLVLFVSPPLYKNQAYIHPFFVEMNILFFAGSEIFMEVNNILDRNSKFLTNKNTQICIAAYCPK
jgi:hypothetical protein